MFILGVDNIVSCLIKGHLYLRNNQWEASKFIAYHEGHLLEGLDAGEEDSEPTLVRMCGILVTKFPQCWVLFGSKVMKGDAGASCSALLCILRQSGCYIRVESTNVSWFSEENKENGCHTRWRCYWCLVIGTGLNWLQ